VNAPKLPRKRHAINVVKSATCRAIVIPIRGRALPDPSATSAANQAILLETVIRTTTAMLMAPALARAHSGAAPILDVIHVARRATLPVIVIRTSTTLAATRLATAVEVSAISSEIASKHRNATTAVVLAISVVSVISRLSLRFAITANRKGISAEIAHKPPPERKPFENRGPWTGSRIS